MAFSEHAVDYYGDHIFTTVTASASVVDKWMDYFPQSLIDFLGYKRFTFVGKEVMNDAHKLKNDYGLVVGHCEDVAHWAAANYGGEEDYRRFGLKRLVLKYLKKELEKPLKITLSRWEFKKLSYQQMKYACLDAFFSIKLGEFLSKAT
ncbi:unnamed protein product [Dovyalis caffra]|uniref:3'-5' exonuclease domain-containing protein n=1 Tax=Dovyalis caffra TaxID=77055 RepID=A0AAV1R315_9ROSI|nr:unnamed protein product [Dovyalis caffra]